MIHMAHEMDIDDDNHLYQMLFDNAYMLSIVCKPTMSSTLLGRDGSVLLSVVAQASLYNFCVHVSSTLFRRCR
jgi:hypothetical protein